ncbi:unnamed protein product, partial [Medioppia subpectinata]
MTVGFIACGPNEALVVSGCGHRRPRVVAGGRVFVWPLAQRVQRLSLNVMAVTVESVDVLTREAVPLTVRSLAIAQISGHNQRLLESACEQLLGKSVDEIQCLVRETLDGHQRASMANTTVERIAADSARFAALVSLFAEPDMTRMGLTIVSYTVQDISDGGAGYLRAIGATATARVKRDARIGEAEAARDAAIGEALTEQQLMRERYAIGAAIARAAADFQLKSADNDIHVLTMRAETDLSYRLMAAKMRQLIKAEEMEVKVIERAQEVRLLEQEVRRKTRELDATVCKVAEADRYAADRLSEAHRNAIVMEAEAEAIGIMLRAEAEASAIVAKARAEADLLANISDAVHGKRFNDRWPAPSVIVFALFATKADDKLMSVFVIYC